MPEGSGTPEDLPARVPELPAGTERFLRLLVGDVQDYAIYLLDPVGRVASWNSGARKIKGYERAEIVGRHFSAFYPPEAIAKGWPDYELRMAAQHGRFADEGWRLRKDGSRFWASVVITALRPSDAMGAGFIKITRDLTERREAEEAIRLSEERLRLLIDGVREYAIFQLSPEGLVVTWNAGAQRTNGYQADEIIGRHFSCFYPPDAVSSGKPEWELRTASQEGSVEDEGWRVRKDGTRYWANVVLTALVSAEGKTLGFVKITRDMTDRRKIEELLHADRQKNEFLALLTHELRNPLAPIRNALHVLAQPGVDPATSAQLRDIAWRQVDHMARLLDDLLDVTQISQGRIELRRERVSLNKILTRSIEDAAPILTERRHQLTLDVPRESLWVDGDPARLEQVFTNLLINAAKYTDPGGRISVTARREGRHVVARIRDTGIGIDPLMAASIFDLFVQGERRTERSSGGIGIGLTLVRRLVELHEGAVDVLSAGPGKGSEFAVSLPTVDRPVLPSKVLNPGRLFAAPPSMRVLVVDDNVDAANSLAMALRLSGQRVRVAYDGETALSFAAEDPPEAVLLDLGMPGMDGYQVARQLRGNPATCNVFIVALTGWGQDEDRRKSHAAGFDRHLVKPVDPSVVSRVLATLAGAGPAGNTVPPPPLQ
jgi:PAS domain S-box-containing protein